MIVTSAVASPGASPAAVVVTYTITGPSNRFASSAAAYLACSNALTTTVASGVFSKKLQSRATANAATYLANIPRQVSTQDLLITQANSPTAIPVIASTPPPTYMPGVPTASPTSAPTSLPTSFPAYMYVVQVRKILFYYSVDISIFLFQNNILGRRHSLASRWTSITANPIAISPSNKP